MNKGCIGREEDEEAADIPLFEEEDISVDSINKGL